MPWVHVPYFLEQVSGNAFLTGPSRPSVEMKPVFNWSPMLIFYPLFQTYDGPVTLKIVPPFSNNAMYEPCFIHFFGTALLHHSIRCWTVYQKVLEFRPSYRMAVRLLYMACMYVEFIRIVIQMGDRCLWQSVFYVTDLRRSLTAVIGSRSMGAMGDFALKLWKSWGQCPQ